MKEGIFTNIEFKFDWIDSSKKTRLVQRRRILTFYCILTPFIYCWRVNFPRSIFRKQSIELTFVLRQIDFPCSIISYVCNYLSTMYMPLYVSMYFSLILTPHNVCRHHEIIKPTSYVEFFLNSHSEFG